MYGQIREFYTFRDTPRGPSSLNSEFFFPARMVDNSIDAIDRILSPAKFGSAGRLREPLAKHQGQRQPHLRQLVRADGWAVSLFFQLSTIPFAIRDSRM